MEISVYDVHHIISKYLNLRQHVYIVSDWLVFFCSFLCCQCGEYLDVPVDGLSDASSVMYQITPRKLEVNTVQSDEELFPSALGDAAEIPGNELWSHVDKPRELDGKLDQITPKKLEVNTVQSDEDLFTSALGDAAEIPGNEVKCTELWSHVDKPRELDGKLDQITPKKLEVNTVQSDEELFTSALGDAAEIPGNEVKCTELWSHVDKPRELDGKLDQITPKKLEVNTVQSDEELFTSALGDAAESPGNKLKCTELWSLVDQPRELDGKVAQGNNFEPSLTLTDSFSAEILSPTTSRNNDYPTVHSHKRLQEQHQISEE